MLRRCYSFFSSESIYVKVNKGYEKCYHSILTTLSASKALAPPSMGSWTATEGSDKGKNLWYRPFSYGASMLHVKVSKSYKDALTYDLGRKCLWWVAEWCQKDSKYTAVLKWGHATWYMNAHYEKGL